MINLEKLKFTYFIFVEAVLVLYLTRKLGFNDDISSIIYHTFIVLVYVVCVICAIVADSWLGKFKTIFYLLIEYAVGTLVLSLSAITPLNLPGRYLNVSV